MSVLAAAAALRQRGVGGGAPTPPPPSGMANTFWVPRYDLPAGMAINPATGRVEGAPFAWQYAARTGGSVTLPSSATMADLQAALDGAAKGSTIYVDPTSLFLGTLRLPVRDETWTLADTVYIETTGFRTLVSDGARVTSAQFTVAGSAMARIYCNSGGSDMVSSEINVPDPDNPGDVISVKQLGVGFVRFVGIEFGFHTSVNPLLAVSSEGVSPGYGKGVVLDRCYYGRDPAWSIGIFFPSYGSYCAMVDSHIENVMDNKTASGKESKCFYFNGTTGFIIRNNYLDASIINGMIGAGQATPAGVYPSDVLVEWNTFSKKASYDGKGVKNLFEIKHGERILVRYNWFERCWTDGQSGDAVNIKMSAGTGTPHAICRHVHFVFNWLDDVEKCVKVAGAPDGPGEEPASTIEIGYNLGTRIGSGPHATLGGAPGFPTTLLGTTNGIAHDWTLHHNTWVNDGATTDRASMMSGALTDWSYDDSITGRGTYGFKGSATEGNASFKLWSVYSFRRNLLIVTGSAPSAGLYADSADADGVTSGVTVVPSATGFAGIFRSYASGDPETGDFRINVDLAALPQYQDAAGRARGADIDVAELVRTHARSGVTPGGY